MGTRRRAPREAAFPRPRGFSVSAFAPCVGYAVLAMAVLKIA